MHLGLDKADNNAIKKSLHKSDEINLLDTQEHCNITG